jgi:hypothetical protein
MKDIALNPLSKKQRKLLQWGVVLMLGVFLIGYFLFQEQKNTSVFVDDQKLHTFDEIMSLEYPNRLTIHNPYLLLVQPEEQLTHIFNLNDRKIENTVKEISLDYQDGKLLYMKNNSTFLDELDLGILCEKGLIKSPTEVLCVTKINPDTNTHKLVSINLGTQVQKDVYVSKNIITELGLSHDKFVLGEINTYNRKNYLVIDGEQFEVPSVVSLIFENQDRSYFASFKNALNSQEAYYEIVDNKAIKQEGNILIFINK